MNLLSSSSTNQPSISSNASGVGWPGWNGGSWTGGSWTGGSWIVGTGWLGNYDPNINNLNFPVVEAFNQTFWELLRFHLGLYLESEATKRLDYYGLIQSEPLGGGRCRKYVKDTYFNPILNFRQSLLTGKILLPFTETLGLLRLVAKEVPYSEYTGIFNCWRWLGVLGKSADHTPYFTNSGLTTLSRALPELLTTCQLVSASFDEQPEHYHKLIVRNVPHHLWASVLVALSPEDANFWAEIITKHRKT